MMNTITRAGLAISLALLPFGAARAEEAIEGGAREAGFAGPDDRQEPDWSDPVQLLSARKALADGRVDEAAAALRRIQATAGNGYAPAFATALGWQNLEFQFSKPAESTITAAFRLAADDREYLLARTVGTAASFEKANQAAGGRHIPTRRALATIAADEGRWAEARPAFEALVREAPNDAETKVRFAFAAYYQRELDLALQMFAGALDADPRSAEAWYGSGVIWLGRGLFDSAEKALRKAGELDPIHWKAREALIQALAGQGKFAEAKPLREKLRELAPKLKRIGEKITVAVLPREGGAAVVREALLESVPWRFRIELFDQARAGGKPIKITELRRDGEAFAWGEVAESGEFRAVKTLAALPELERVLEEAK